MAYLYIRIKGVITETVEGQQRIKATAVEVAPRNLNINLTKADAKTIALFEQLTGKAAMVPLREGMMNGQSFFKLEQGDIIPMPDSSPAPALSK
jgi:hypothetical protein